MSQWNIVFKPIFHCTALRPQTQNFDLGIPTCWFLKMLKFALPPTRMLNFALTPTQMLKFVLPPTRMLKFVLPPTQNPNMSQWNIGCVGSQAQNSRVGHVHFFSFCVDFILVGSRFFSGIWALKCNIYISYIHGYNGSECYFGMGVTGSMKQRLSAVSNII